MTHSRRDLLKASPWALALPLLSTLPGRLLAQAGQALSNQEAEIYGYFERKGYAPVPALNCITGDTFNDGLRYDESFAGDYPAQNTLRIQGCARTEDLARKGEPGVLPYFHIVDLQRHEPAFRGEVLTDILEYFAGPMGLDPGRMVFVSTDKFAAYQPALKGFGIEPHQIIERSRKEAMATGDGSGYFAPKGHPHTQGLYTASIHYPLPGTENTEAESYPLPGYLELGEIVLANGNTWEIESESGGFGLERVLMAAGKFTEDFSSSQQLGLKALQQEADTRQVPLPKGYGLIESA